MSNMNYVDRLFKFFCSLGVTYAALGMLMKMEKKPTPQLNQRDFSIHCAT